MFDKNQGQIMIIILLVMVVSLTIGLSFASRQLTNIRLTSQTEQSQKAFSAAEAGIEDALRRDLWELTTTGPANIPLTSIGNAQYQVNIVRTDFTGTNEFVSESSIRRDDVTQVITKGLGGKELEIYWGPGSDDNANSGVGSCGSPPPQVKCVASLEIVEVYKDIASVWKINRYTYNPLNNPHPSAGINGFGFTPTVCTSPNCTFGGLVFTETSGKIILDVGTELVRIKPIYYSSIIGVKSTLPDYLPVQSVTISSTGSIGGISRKIEVTRSFDILPSVFDFAVYSGGDGTEPLTK
jgi:hypothetical protein